MYNLENQNKAGSFVNVATIREDESGGKYRYEENVNDILARKENQYKGWLCWSGIESLMISANGDVFNASCRVIKLGNIHTDFDIPTEPITCSKITCVCAADLNTSKAKDSKSAAFLRKNDDQ